MPLAPLSFILLWYTVKGMTFVLVLRALTGWFEWIATLGTSLCPGGSLCLHNCRMLPLF